MSLVLTPKQSHAFSIVLSEQYQLIIFGGAVGGGKSIWLLSVFVALANEYPYSRWIIVRDTVPTLKRTTLKTFDQYFLQNGLMQHIIRFDQSSMTIYFKNGSEITFMAENYDDDKELFRFRGLEVNGFGCDEINELHEETLNKMFERIGRWKPPKMKKVPKPLILGTCNPSNNWVKDRIYDPYRQGKLPEGWAYIVSKISDNPYLSDEYKANLKANMTPIDYQKFVEGDWDAKHTTNNFATYFEHEKHVLPCDLQLNRVLYISIDFNLNPFGMIASHIWNDADGFHYHIVAEESIENGSIQAMIHAIKVRFYSWLPIMVISGDYNGNKGDLSQIDRASYYEQIRRGLRLKRSQIVTPSNPTHLDSRTECNYVLFYHPDFRIDPSCKRTIYDLENVEVDAFGQIIKKDRKDLKQQADQLDAWRYQVHAHLGSWIKYRQRTPE